MSHTKRIASDAALFRSPKPKKFKLDDGKDSKSSVLLSSGSSSSTNSGANSAADLIRLSASSTPYADAKNNVSDGKSSAPNPEKNADKQADIAATCAAVVYFTKNLLGYGAGNNLEDMKHSKLHSVYAMLCCFDWPYISHKNYYNPLLSLDKTSQIRFFYNPKYESDQNRGALARAACVAMLSRSGSCDYHAFLVAELLKQFLPQGTPINICTLASKSGKKKDIKHTFVVVGEIKPESSPSDRQLNNHLLVVDAWTIQGGVVELKNYIYRKNDEFYLQITYPTIRADGKKYLLNMLIKQKQLIQDKTIIMLPANGFNPDNKTDCTLHPSLYDLNNIVDVSYDLDEFNFYDVDSLTDQPYQDPPNTKNKIKELLQQNPELNILIQMTNMQLKAKGVAKRLNSGTLETKLEKTIQKINKELQELARHIPPFSPMPSFRKTG